MSYRNKVIAAALLSFAALAPGSFASAADLPVKAKAKPVPDVPFFFVIDNRVTYSFEPRGTDPGAFSAKPGGGFNGVTAKSVFSFSHFDVWAYGTNFFIANYIKSDHNDPAGPCTNAGFIFTTPASCAGAVEFFGKAISTFGWNELFNTKAFTMGPLHNISFQIASEYETENSFLAPAKRAFMGGLQFAFDLPYKGFFNISPLAYKEINHNSFDQCGLFGPGVPGVTCLADGNTNFKTTWAVEVLYYMDLGFLPPDMQFFAISGRAGWYGPKGNQNQPLGLASGGTATKTELNSEPIRLTFDASKAVWGAKYTHFVDVWVAWRYWQNKFGLDHDNAPGVCTIAGPGTPSTNSCTESSVYTGITVKF
jgi:hypothetical protein